MENHGTVFKTRWKLLRERVQAVKEIWTKDEAEFHGELVDFDPIWSFPKPVQKPHPPILLGGDTPRTRQRVVDYCNGWMPIGMRTAGIVEGMKDLAERARAAGKKPDRFPGHRLRRPRRPGHARQLCRGRRGARELLGPAGEPRQGVADPGRLRGSGSETSIGERP